MSSVITIPNMRDGYAMLCRQVMEQGDPVAPRGLPTRELRDVIITVLNVVDTLPVGIGRKPNPRIAAAEAMQLVGAFSSPKLMTRISPAFETFIDGGRFHGAYGRRVGTQLQQVVQKLRNDPDTRQAVVTLWDPRLDNSPGFSDYPCTLSLTFTIRMTASGFDALNMHVTMRSNDVWLGLAYDVFQFTQLQLTIARCLNLAVGEYNHHDISLHAYERDFDKIEQLEAATFVPPPDNLPRGFGSDEERTFTDAQNAARKIGRAARRPHDFRALTESEQWYADVLEDVLHG